ncbi:MAG: family 20 glycosylhydrolase [Bacteroidales bacterium]|nr:family 20 glycosylhydrolase [Bacteroidales bacterium]
MKKILLFFLCLATATVIAQNTHILPTPQQVQWQKGSFSWNERAIDAVLVNHLEVPRNEDQAYRLTISQDRVLMEATSETGLFYAEQSLKQLYRYASTNRTDIPCMTILDWPDFKLRGWQDDISRGPIVSMDYLKRLIPQLAECKLNAFSLYTEHTFRTKSHPDIAPIDAFTAEEIQELDAFCKQYHIQLIGNQQCFAHFEEILKNPFYEYLADAPDNLNPGILETYDFLEDLIREETQAYTSPLFNINCDETESLGSGKAKTYVDSVGKETAYYLHINRVNDIVRRHGKRAMMWGDIADQHPEILNNLDKDIIFLAWSYAARESYDEFLKPYVESGHEFIVAPGVSLSERVLPKYQEFMVNIPNLCRDGFRNGAVGVLNTCWDDFGESLTNSALYGLLLGAEKSWNPMSKDEIEWNDDLPSLINLSRIAQNDGIGKFSAMWEPITPFYPSLVEETFLTDNVKALNELDSLALQLANDNALYAAHRMRWCALRNLARGQLYKTYQDPTAENIAESKRQIDSLLVGLHRLKNKYIKVWNQESRPYWLEVNLEKYDRAARELKALAYLPFIESETDAEGHVTVTLRTIYNDQPIHYSIDGKAVTPTDPVYEKPVVLTRSGLVKATCFDDMGRAVSNERYFLYHKGMGKLKALNSPAGNYRPEYSGGGDKALVDGRLGSENYKDGRWQGFYGVDADIELDLKQKENIHEIEIGFLANPHDWILQANQVEIYTSSDGVTYQSYLTHEIQSQIGLSGNVVFRERIPTADLSTRYLRLVVKNPGLIPEGLPGFGYDSWIFMDEIILK